MDTRHDELRDRSRCALRPAAPASPLGRRLCETVQVGGGILIELKGSRQCVEHLRGGMLIAALLETDVVVSAHAGQHRHLLAPQTGRAAPP